MKDLVRMVIKSLIDAVFAPGKTEEQRRESVRAILEFAAHRLDGLEQEQQERNARVDAAVDAQDG